MAYPTEYTETSLAQWLATRLGPLADEVGWTLVDDPSPAPGDFQNVVDETLHTYGVSTIEGATDTAKLRAIALYWLWELVHEHLMAEYDSTTDGQGTSRNQLVQNVERKLARAFVAASAYLPAVPLRVANIRYSTDPYTTAGSAGDEWSG